MKPLIKSWLGGVLVAVLLVPAVCADEVAIRAESFVKNLAEMAVAELTDETLSRSEQEGRFRGIIEKHVAVKSIARWVVGGRHWRRAQEEERSRYISLFTDLMVATYAHRFQDYDGETLRVEGVQSIDPTQTLVRTIMQRPGADRGVRIDWRIRETDSQLRVIDVMVEGLSMAQTQRSEFSSFLRANGNSFEALLVELERRLGEARKNAVAEAAQNP